MKYTESDRLVTICHHYSNVTVWDRHSTFTVTDGTGPAFTSLSMACCEEKRWKQSEFNVPREQENTIKATLLSYHQYGKHRINIKRLTIPMTD